MLKEQLVKSEKYTKELPLILPSTFLGKFTLVYILY